MCNFLNYLPYLLKYILPPLSLTHGCVISRALTETTSTLTCAGHEDPASLLHYRAACRKYRKCVVSPSSFQRRQPDNTEDKSDTLFSIKPSSKRQLFTICIRGDVFYILSSIKGELYGCDMYCETSLFTHIKIEFTFYIIS